MKSFKFKLVKPDVVSNIWKTHWFAGGSIIITAKGEKVGLGQLGGVNWGEYSIDPMLLYFVMREIFGDPNQPSIDDAKMTFNYIFKSRKHKGIYFEIYDYYGVMSCGVGRSMSFVTTKEIAESINDELRELIHELVIAYNLMKAE